MTCSLLNVSRSSNASEVRQLLRYLSQNITQIKTSFFLLAQTFYVRGCLRDVEVIREDIPTVRENGCWTVDGEYVGWGRNIFIETDKTVYCFCDERDGCNRALSLRYISVFNILFGVVAFVLFKFLFY